MHSVLIKAVALTTAVLLAACAQSPLATPATPTAAPVFAPNANLFTQGIPPIPQALVDRVANYTDFRGHGFVDWHPLQRQMVVAHRKAGDNLA